MAKQPAQSVPEAQLRKGLSPTVKLTLLVIPLVVIVTGWVFWQELQQSPTRQAGVTIPPYEVITIRLSTDPFPALATGTVQMTLRLQAAGGQMPMVERVSYTYGPVDGDEVFAGQAQTMGTDMYHGPLRFTRTGDWWIKVKVENRGVSDEATFTIPVKPAL